MYEFLKPNFVILWHYSVPFQLIMTSIATLLLTWIFLRLLSIACPLLPKTIFRAVQIFTIFLVVSTIWITYIHVQSQIYEITIHASKDKHETLQKAGVISYHLTTKKLEHDYIFIKDSFRKLLSHADRYDETTHWLKNTQIHYKDIPNLYRRDFIYQIDQPVVRGRNLLPLKYKTVKWLNTYIGSRVSFWDFQTHQKWLEDHLPQSISEPIKNTQKE